jgi:hypothetical protein
MINDAGKHRVKNQGRNAAGMAPAADPGRVDSAAAVSRRAAKLNHGGNGIDVLQKFLRTLQPKTNVVPPH